MAISTPNPDISQEIIILIQYKELSNLTKNVTGPLFWNDSQGQEKDDY